MQLLIKNELINREKNKKLEGQVARLRNENFKTIDIIDKAKNGLVS